MNGAKSVASRARVSTSWTLAGRGVLIWRIFAVLSVVVLSYWYVTAHRQPSADGHRSLVITLGWIGTALTVLAASLSIRKRMAYQGAGKLSAWLAGHIYLGVVAAFAIFYHSGFRTGSPLTASLLAFFSLTVVSGLLGWWLSRAVPPLLTEIEETPAIQEQLLSVRAECLRGMLELAAGGSAEFRAVVEQRLMKETASWKRMVRFYRKQSTLSQELPAFQKEHEDDLRRLKQHEHRAFEKAAEYALRANKMSAELLLQRVLRGWLTLHMVNTAAMFGLAAIHIFSVLYF